MTVAWTADPFGAVPVPTNAPPTATVGANGNIYLAQAMVLYSIGPDGMEKGSTSQQIWTGPLVGANGSLDSLGPNFVFNVDAASGSLLWFSPTAWFPSGSSPLHAPDLALTFDGKVIAPDGNGISAFSSAGATVWSVSLGSSPLLSAPAIGPDGTIYASGTAGLFAISPSGMVNWTQVLPGQNEKTSATVGVDGTVYVGMGPTIYALSSDGTVLWSKTPGGSTASFSWIGIGPDGTLIAVDGFGQGGVHALSHDGATVEWSFVDGGGYGTAPAIGADGKVYVALGSQLYGFGAGGEHLFSLAGPAPGTAGNWGPPSIGADGTLYDVTYGDVLYALTSAPACPGPCDSPPASECYDPSGFCSGSSCTYRPLPSGTSCLGGQGMCDGAGNCKCGAGGPCESPPSTCYASTGTCGGTGTCTYAPLPSGTSCLGGEGMCDGAGSCKCGASGPCNTPPGSCYAATGTCDATNTCTYPLLPSGTSCLAGEGKCDGAGNCGCGAGGPCDTPPGTCYVATGTCDATDTCVYAPAPAGATCPGGNCDGSGTCIVCSCPAAIECYVAVCTPTGCADEPAPRFTPCGSCGNRFFCGCDGNGNCSL